MAKILLVDDDPVTLRIIRSMLQKRDYDTLGAGSVKEAIRYLESDVEIDVVVADIVMPKVTGFDLLRHMSKSARLHDVPVILCSSQGNKETLIEGMESGAKDFIVKPFKAETLVAKVEKALCQGRPGILVVSGETTIRERLAYTVALEGFHAFSAIACEEALRIVEENRVDVICADMDLPEVGDGSFAGRVKLLHENVSVLAITGASNHFTSDLKRRSGVDGFIMKPFRNTEIVELLREIVRELRDRSEQMPPATDTNAEIEG